MGRIILFLIIAMPAQSMASLYDHFDYKQGVINEDELWSGKIMILSDVLIPAGVTVSVAPDSWLIFNEANLAQTDRASSLPRLQVDGTLDILTADDATVQVYWLGSHQVQDYIRSVNATQEEIIAPEPVDTTPLREQWHDYKKKYAILWAVLYSLWLVF